MEQGLREMTTQGPMIALSRDHSLGTARHQLSPKVSAMFAFRDFKNLETEDDIVTVEGCTEVVVQGRMCGDFYAEVNGPAFCVSATSSNAADALRAALARAHTTKGDR